MVKSYWERRQNAKAAILAAREALDALERRLERYWEACSSDTSHKTYMRLEQARYLSSLKSAALGEAAEAAHHLQDAIWAWWVDKTIDWPDDRDEPQDQIADDPGPDQPDAA